MIISIEEKKKTFIKIFRPYFMSTTADNMF